MTIITRPMRWIAPGVFLFSPSALGQEQHDYTETEIPCGIRCALGAATLFSEEGRLPQFDVRSLNELPSKGRSLLDIKQFLSDHGMYGKAFADVPIDSLNPTPDAPIILQLSPAWLENAVKPRPGFAFELDGLPHFVLAVKRNGGELLIWDVSVGHESLSLAELQPYFTGNAMIVQRRTELLGALLERHRTSTYLLAGAVVLLGAAAILRFIKGRRRIPESRQSEKTTN